MSTNIELESTTLDTVSTRDVDVDIPVEQSVVSDKEKDVSVLKKEYSIVGDSLFASMNTEDAPAWLTAIIDSVVQAEISGSLTDLTNAHQSILTAIDEIEIAKNEYQELINIESTIDSIITSKLTTLNATVDNNASSILSLDATKVTESEAYAISANQINAELNGGAIGSEINRVDIAIANTNSTLASTTDTLTASFGDLSTAQSTLENSVLALEDSVSSNFSYNSTLQLGDDYYTTGFGIKSDITLSGTGTETDPYDSEFWVQAERFKVISTDSTDTEVVNAIFNVNSSTGLVSIGEDITEATRNVVRGDYVSSTPYQKGDIVQYSGSSYMAKEDTTGNVPTNTIYWELLAQKGTDGTDGTDGDRGAVSVTDTYSSSPSDSDFTSTIQSKTGHYPPIEGDNIIYTIPSAGTKTAYYNGNSWIDNVQLYVNGDAVVDGTLHASKITAGHIGSVTYKHMFQGDITATAPFASNPTSGGTYVGGISYTNSADTPVNIVVILLGRTGIDNNPEPLTGSCYFRVNNDADTGWTPSWQDTKALTFKDTIGAKSTGYYTVYGYRASEDSSYQLTADFGVSIVGVKE